MPGFNIGELEFSETELTGARLTIPFTPLRRLGPKHHAILIGQCDKGEVWIAELSRRFGYRLVALTQWLADNERYVDDLDVRENTGPQSNQQVARNAVEEVQRSKSQYNVVFNNCENFADRNQNGTLSLSPQVKSTLKVMGVVLASGSVALYRVLKSNRSV